MPATYNYDPDGEPCCPTSGPCSAHDTGPVLEPCPHVCPRCARCPDCCECPEQSAQRLAYFRARVNAVLTDVVETNARILREREHRP